MSSGISVLSLTSGIALLERRPDGSLNSQQLRQLEYANHLDSYFIITRTVGRERFAPRELSPNVVVYPSNSCCRLSFRRDAMRIASRICNEHRIDVISPRDPFLFGRVGVRLKRKYGIPLAVHIMGDMIDNPYFLRERFANRIMNRWAKAVLREADAIRVASTVEKEKIVKLGYPEEKVFRVAFFIDFGPFIDADGSARRAELLGDRFESIILTVGRLEKQKNVPMLIDTAAKVVAHNPKVLFVIAGGGNVMEKARKKIRSLNIEDNVILPGHVENSALPEYYHAADIFTMSSNYEGIPMVLFEASACGLPIVSTRMTGAIDTILDSETGYIVPIGDADALANRLLELVENPDRAREMGAKGRAHVLKKFDKEKIVKDYITMWEYAASAKGK